MPKIVKEELFRLVDLPALYIVTTNGVVTRNGALVMGAGAAKQLVQRAPGIDEEAGAFVVHSGVPQAGRPGVYQYGFLAIRSPLADKVGIGIFQTKYEWQHNSHLPLIDLSVSGLVRYAYDNPRVSIRMNYPGIGLGGLTKEQVEPILDVLPQNVTVCYR
jgi:hypothetical protein